MLKRNSGKPRVANKTFGVLIIILCLISFRGHGGSLSESVRGAHPDPRPQTASAFQPLQPNHRCELFSDGHQELDPVAVRIKKYKSILFKCRGNDTRDAIAIRQFEQDGLLYFLTVDSNSLETKILRASCLECAPTSNDAIASTRFAQSLRLTTAAPFLLQNDGLTEAREKSNGSFLTGDLCPSHKPLDRAFFSKIKKTSLHLVNQPIPISLSVSGAWIRNHFDDLHWLKGLVAQSEFQVTWVNHSNTHPFDPEAPLEQNFLLRPGVDLTHEVIEAEKTMIQNGLTPSVFFRFPGLISNQSSIETIKSLHLIPLGAAAWLAKGAKPQPGQILLVHPNGNEPYGLERFVKLLAEARIPLPLLSLTRAP
jgi:hypothetical protein